MAAPCAGLLFCAVFPSPLTASPARGMIRETKGVAAVYDVVALGEILVDFCQSGTVEGVPQFGAYPGGAPCNVLAYLARHGRKTGFIGRVGSDLLGRYLRDTAANAGIDTRGITVDPQANTTLAFVSTDAAGERGFSFFRNAGADCRLSAAAVDFALIAQSRIFHFGSLSMTHAACRGATAAAVQAARQSGALISFDPNYRPMLWESEALAREQMRFGCSACDFLKIERSELAFLTGIADERAAVERLLAEFPITLVTVTAGAGGAAAYYGGTVVRQAAVPVDAPVDTTGAGDAFCGGCLDWLLSHPIGSLTPDSLRQMLRRACAGAALVVTKQGALLSMPTRAQVDAAL